MNLDKMKKRKREFGITTTQMIACGFMVVILIGALLLTLPCMTKSGQWTSFVDALFMSTTSVCVTGLSLVNVFEYWSFLGQVVILVLIQIGGIGVVSMTILFFMLIGKKVTLKNRLLIQESYNMNSLAGLVRTTKNILKGIAVVETAGALLYCIQFVPQFGPGRGIWISVFNSVSAFCNAGIDVLGGDSLAQYYGNPLINMVTMLLIILGGIGFFVWWDTIHVVKKWRKTGIKNCFWKLNLHSKMVITITFFLIFGGAFAIFLLEYSNPETIGHMTFLEKIQASLFQSVTTRTAGFSTINQAELRESTSLISMILMFIGGSPVGTAGGVKTMTIALIAASTMSVVKGEKEVVVFRRAIPKETVRKAIAVFFISCTALVVMVVLMSLVQDAPLHTIVYEVVSALATVGLSKNFTASLNLLGKIIIIVCMYIGRIGPISMLIAFRIRSKQNIKIHFPEEEVIVG
ncbi:MAG: TrkH family potassium uptake protein [Lachnospiraceae bacterium]|nr:TrkH family potassium uptake protein [Lachnospiraceae bacterium]